MIVNIIGYFDVKNEHSPNHSLNFFSSKYFFPWFLVQNGPNNVECHMYKVKKQVKNGSSSDLKIIDIRVEEQPSGEISAGAGIGTDGGSFAFNVEENNWLGEGKNVGIEFELSTDSVKGSINYVDPNYDLLGNSISYNLPSTRNDKPNQGYENSVISVGVGTGFEQYKNVFTNLSLFGTHDDLRTNSSASASLKKQKGYKNLSENSLVCYNVR